MSDGGENVRRMQEYLHPFSEHLIDCSTSPCVSRFYNSKPKDSSKSSHKQGKTYRSVWQA